MSQRAKPCPYCSTENLWVWESGVPGKFAIACSNPACAATGPIASTEEWAVQLWNVALRQHKGGMVSGRLQRLLDELNPLPEDVERERRRRR